MARAGCLPICLGEARTFTQSGALVRASHRVAPPHLASALCGARQLASSSADGCTPFTQRNSLASGKARECGITPFRSLRLAVVASTASDSEGGKRVLVVGATGGVGQLVVSSLVEKGLRVRAVVRNPDRARAVLAGAEEGQVEIVSADLRFPEQLGAALFDDVAWVVLCTGTTAFPSKRWQDNNGPEQTDFISVKNFLAACPMTLQRLVFVSSCGVLRSDQLPFSILNLFGVLKFKRMAEELVQTCGVPYAILRPGRLTDGPYTSYDLNTLLQATSGSRKAVVVKRGDSLSVETSRIAVAEAAVQALFSDAAKDGVFEIGSVEGPWVGSKLGDWDEIFATAPVA